MVDTVIRVFANRAPNPKYYGKVNPDFFVKAWVNIMEQGIGRAYGSFREEAPQGFLLGMIVPDLNTGDSHGLVHTWMSNAGSGLDLLRAFEKDCKSESCVMTLAGLSHFMEVEPWKLRRIYEARGYTPHGESFSKRL